MPGQTVENCQDIETSIVTILICQDIVARVFKLQLKSLLHDIYYGKKPVLGKMIALIYVTEWQKRGPPHVHILGICDQATKPSEMIHQLYLLYLCIYSSHIITPLVNSSMYSYVMHRQVKEMVTLNLFIESH